MPVVSRCNFILAPQNEDLHVLCLPAANGYVCGRAAFRALSSFAYWSRQVPFNWLGCCFSDHLIDRCSPALRHVQITLSPLNILSAHETLMYWVNARAWRYNCGGCGVAESGSSFPLLPFQFASSLIFIACIYERNLNFLWNSILSCDGINFSYQKKGGS